MTEEGYKQRVKLRYRLSSAGFVVSELITNCQGLHTLRVQSSEVNCLLFAVPEEKETLLSRQLSRPPGLLSAGSTPRSTPRTTPSRSKSPSEPRKYDVIVLRIIAIESRFWRTA